MSKRNLQKLVEARMAKTGEGWATALRHVRAQVAGRKTAQAPGAEAPGVPAADLVQAGSGEPPRPKSVTELLAELQTPSTFAVMVGRVHPHASADPMVVAKQADDLARDPKYHAWTGHSGVLVSLDQHNQLIAAGAVDERKGQILRSHRFVDSPLDRVTFSDQCKCGRWIWCGEADRESTCVCGRSYRVSFDLLGDLVWAKRQYQRCADCGIEFAMHPVADRVSPWRPLNEWQVQCNNCHEEDEERGPAAPSAAIVAGNVIEFVQPTEPPKIHVSRLSGAVRNRRRPRAA